MATTLEPRAHARISAAPTRSAARSSRTALKALVLRDLVVLRKNFWEFVIRTLVQPFLLCFVFLYVFPKIGQGIGAIGHAGPSFATILVPGLVAVAINFQGIQAVALPLVQEFSYTKEIEDRILAPVPVWMVGLEKILSGVIQSIVAAAVVFPIVLLVHAKGQAPEVHVASWPLFLVVVLLASFLGASFGLLIGTTFDPRKLPLLFSLIVIPITFLGCVYYPWATLSPIPWLKYAVLVNPLVYMSEGLRAALTPSLPHMPEAAFLSVLSVGTLAMALLALRMFHRRVVD